MSHYAYIPPSSSVQVSTEPGILVGVYSGGGSPPIDLYDTASGSTSEKMIMHVPPGGGEEFSLPLPKVLYKHGLYVVTGNIACTVFYE